MYIIEWLSTSAYTIPSAWNYFPIFRSHPFCKTKFKCQLPFSVFPQIIFLYLVIVESISLVLFIDSWPITPSQSNPHTEDMIAKVNVEFHLNFHSIASCQLFLGFCLCLSSKASLWGLHEVRNCRFPCLVPMKRNMHDIDKWLHPNMDLYIN